MSIQLESNFDQKPLGADERAFKINASNDIIAVPASWSDAKVENHFQQMQLEQNSDNAKILAENPDVAAAVGKDYYGQHFESPISMIPREKLQWPDHIYEGIEGRARSMNAAFAQSALIQPDEGDILAMEKYPGAKIAGQLQFMVPGIMATGFLADAAGLAKFAEGIGIGARMTVPEATASVEALGSNVGALVQKAVTSLVHSIGSGAVWGGVTKGAEVIKSDIENPDEDKTAALAEVGKSVLDSAIVFSGYSAGALIPSRSVATTAIAGLTYALGRAQGAPEEENILNAVAIAAMHHVSSGGDPKEALHAVRETLTAYVPEKNNIVDKNVAAEVVDTHIADRAKEILARYQAKVDEPIERVSVWKSKKDDLPEDLQPAPLTRIDGSVMPEVKAEESNPTRPEDFATAEEYVASKFRVKPPKKLFRGVAKGLQEDGSEGFGTFNLGRGLYSTFTKSFAKKYGDVVELNPIEAFPKNPLVIPASGDAKGAFADWLLKESGEKRISDFNKKYPDPSEFVKAKGYDGVIVGDEIVKYDDGNTGKDQLTAEWQAAQKKTEIRSASEIVAASPEMTSELIKGVVEDATGVKVETAENVETPAPAGNTGKIADFGEKIGGARKDTAEKTGPKTNTKPTDERPSWQKNTLVMQNNKTIYENRPADMKWYVYKIVKGGRPGEVEKLSQRGFDTEQEAKDAIPLAVVSQNHRVYKTPDGKYAIHRKLSNGNVPIVKGGFETNEEAMKYMANHAPEIIEHTFKFPEKPWLDSIKRVGGQDRGNRDVSTKEFQTRFGFRAGEFGNWNMGSDGQAALNHAYDALNDLADTLGVEPKALSLNGRLAIAFGARGQGLSGATAHFEPDKVVINLTKIRGAGSLAHEWMHALDEYVAHLDEQKMGKATTGFKYQSKLDEKIRTAFKNLMNTITAKEDIRPVDKTMADKSVDRSKEVLNGLLDRIEKGFTYDYSGYKKGWKSPTSEQLKKFTELKNKILNGDYGDKMHVDAPKTAGKWNTGYDTFTNIDAMNKLFKEVTKRSFDSTNRDSVGRSLYHQIKRHQDMLARVKLAGEGATEKNRTATDFLKEAKRIDSYRASEYWARGDEMAARAFEAYINDKIEGNKGRSDYLVYGAKNEYYRGTEEDFKPFPEGADRQAINGAFDKLFEVLDVLPRKAEFGSENKLFTKEMKDAAEKSFKEKTGGLHANLDPTAFADLVKIGGYYIEGGIRDFAKFSEKMIEDFGETIKPYIKDVWDNVQDRLPKPEPVQRQPIDEPRTRVSGLSLSTEARAIKDKLVKDFGDLPKYTARGGDKLAIKIEDFINDNYEQAKRIALGVEPEINELRSQELYTAISLKAQAEGDVATMRELALSQTAADIAAEAGQRVQAYDSGVPTDTVRAIKQVEDVRVNEAEKKIGKKQIKKEVSDGVKDLSEKVQRARIKKASSWAEFVQALEC